MSYALQILLGINISICMVLVSMHMYQLQHYLQRQFAAVDRPDTDDNQDVRDTQTPKDAP